MTETVPCPREVDAVPATVAFVRTIPFVVTAISAAIGAALLASGSKTLQESK
ncbi:hypothetical protein [Nocardia bovistercoris]|uniref:Uncharacterized protein n=1 Tax=Nocardia bovistercoris TaxID=2785916 RepID=A0A931IDC6_9NOCA|nr:hypothetical protein [Nocardia bovistercoris]MBH0778441.1 hypothetical protein [Nocardia bovistercoris]